jgi:hypothetical protein
MHSENYSDLKKKNFRTVATLYICKHFLGRVLRGSVELPLAGVHFFPSQALGSWVRIPFEVWMSLCVHFVSVLSCVLVAAL